MSVNNLDYEDDNFDPHESVKADKTEDELKKEKAKKERKQQINEFIKATTDKAKDKAKGEIEKALGFKLEKEEITNAIHNKVDELTSTALGGVCSLIGLPPNFIKAIIMQNSEMEAINAKYEEDIAYNDSLIKQYEDDIAALNEYIEDYNRKKELNDNAEAEQLAEGVPKHLIDYPYYLDPAVVDRWKEEIDKSSKEIEQLKAENAEIEDKKANWEKTLYKNIKNSPMGIKIKEAVSDLKTKATELIKGIQLLIQNIVALFTEGMGAAVVAMGSGVVVSPSPASIMSSMQKIAATAQALGAVISGIMLAAAELGLNGSKNEYLGGNMPDLITPLEPFAISLGIVASLA